jgi:hypothetical protein
MLLYSVSRMRTWVMRSGRACRALRDDSPGKRLVHRVEHPVFVDVADRFQCGQRELSSNDRRHGQKGARALLSRARRRSSNSRMSSGSARSDALTDSSGASSRAKPACSRWRTISITNSGFPSVCAESATKGRLLSQPLQEHRENARNACDSRAHRMAESTRARATPLM